MPQVCTICSHEQRREIDRALVGGTAKRRIAVDFSVSGSAVWRHFREHIPRLLVKGYEAEEMVEADKLLLDIRRLQAKTLRLLHEAERAGELRTALAAVSQARQNISLLAEMRGELDRSATLNLYIHPKWLELRALIVSALAPHPEAKASVLAAIAEVGNGVAGP